MTDSIIEDIVDGFPFLSEPQSNRCEYLWEYDEPAPSYLLRHRSCCWREKWQNYDRCIWHAETDNKKPAEEFVLRRETRENREQNRAGEFPAELLDGVYLSGTDLTNVGSFEACWFRGADLTDANLQYATLTDANLWQANLTDANLEGAALTGAYLRGATLTDANLYGAALTDAELVGATLTDANLWDAALTDANLQYATLTDANLQYVILTDANLEGAALTGARLRLAALTGTNLANANLSRTNLEDASLSDADLDQTALTDARLHNCRLQSVYISNETTFGTRCAYERAADPYDLLPWQVVSPSMEPITLTADDHHLYQGGQLTAAWYRFRYWTGDFSDRSPDTDDFEDSEKISWQVVAPSMEPITLTADDHHLSQGGRQSTDSRLAAVGNRFRYRTENPSIQSPDLDDIENIEKAISVYRTYQRLHRENSLPGAIPKYYYREKEMRRIKALAEGKILAWIYRALQRWVMGYGERPWRVIGTSLVVIVGFGLVYPFIGGMETADSDTVAFSLVEPLSLPLGGGVGRIFFENLYFSAVTFTTLGYGDIQPGSDTVQLLASIESFLGALLMALLVAVLTRRTMR